MAAASKNITRKASRHDQLTEKQRLLENTQVSIGMSVLGQCFKLQKKYVQVLFQRSFLIKKKIPIYFRFLA